MTGPEKTVERAIVRALRARGALVIKTHGSAFSGSGAPDLIGVLPACTQAGQGSTLRP